MARASMSLCALEADQVKWTLLSICSSTGPFPTHDACGPRSCARQFFDRTLDRDAAT
jgi:hypothetical protein